jgi:hypothetical protein
MVFKSKVQIAAEKEASSAINPGGPGNVSADNSAINPGGPGNVSADNTEKIKKENKSDVIADVKAKKELYEKNQELDEKNKEIERLRKQLETKEVTQAPNQELINQLNTQAAQIDQLSRQVMGAAQGKKLLFRQPIAADLQDESIVFTARSVIYIVASYTDSRGLEQLPPFKLIMFQYAASDIKKDGREETIKNFSQYTTNLKPEIEFLRNHPLYKITFSENTNEMMNEDTKEFQFRESAALQLSTMAPENVYNRARELKIPNWEKKSAAELRFTIVQRMSELYKTEAAALQDDIIRRRVLASAVLQNKEE